MKCAGPNCKTKGTYRFCSNVCFLAYSRKRTEDCQICQWMPLTQSVGNHNARGICADCRKDKTQSEWEDTSELEQTTDDIDDAVRIKGGSRIEAYHGGKRKFNTWLADEIARLAEDDSEKVERRRRRRSPTGNVLRGWELVSRSPNEREIAKKLGCSRAYVHKVLRRLLA